MFACLILSNILSLKLDRRFAILERKNLKKERQLLMFIFTFDGPWNDTNLKILFVFF